MKKIISLAVLSTALLGLFGCGNGGTDTLSTTEPPITLQSVTPDRPFFSFEFDISEEYTHSVISVNSGSLSKFSASATEDKLRLKSGDSFYWAPNSKTEETTVIAVQICNGENTVCCGTISLVKKISLLGNEEPTYVAVLDSDDGMQIRQNGDNRIIIFK